MINVLQKLFKQPSKAKRIERLEYFVFNLQRPQKYKVGDDVLYRDFNENVKSKVIGYNLIKTRSFLDGHYVFNHKYEILLEGREFTLKDIHEWHLYPIQPLAIEEDATDILRKEYNELKQKVNHEVNKLEFIASNPKKYSVGDSVNYAKRKSATITDYQLRYHGEFYNAYKLEGEIKDSTGSVWHKENNLSE